MSQLLIDRPVSQTIPGLSEIQRSEERGIGLRAWRKHTKDWNRGGTYCGAV